MIAGDTKVKLPHLYTFGDNNERTASFAVSNENTLKIFELVDTTK